MKTGKGLLCRTLCAASTVLLGSVAVLGTGATPAGATGATGATGGAPFVVALASCFEHSSATFGVSYLVRVDVAAYNLPPSADGTSPSGAANTDFYVNPDGQYNLTENAMATTNGTAIGGSFLDSTEGAQSYTVTVYYKVPGGTLIEGPGSAATTAPVHVTVPDISQCGTSNETSASSVPGTNTGGIVGMASTPDGLGYWMVGSDGRVYSYGDASNFYDQDDGSDFYILNKPIVGMAASPDGHGYWLVASDGGIFNFGDAGFYGSTGGTPLNKPIVGMEATPDGNGYWLVASDGGIFAYGDAQFFGSTGGMRLNQPIVGMAADDATGGYWLVAADGGIFSYDAPFLGSTGNLRLNKPIVGMEAAPDGSGYRFVASDGGVFSYGLPFAGSTGGIRLNQPITGMAPAGAAGYWLGAADGGLFNFGAPFYGSAA